MLWEKICGGSFLWQVADITGEAHIRADITAPAVLAAVVIQADTLVRAVSPAEVTIVMAEALIPVYIDSERIESVRKKLPSYGNRRPELYTV